MKILAIGDFHGKFPKKLLNRINNEKYDLIVSPGDYCGNKEYAKLFFEHVYGTDKEMEEAIGKRKTKKLEKENYESGKKILKQLNKLSKVIGVTGNWDPINYAEIGFEKRKENYSKQFKKLTKQLKNIRIIDFKNYKFRGYNFIGYPRSTYPGKVTQHITKKFKEKYKKEAKKIFNKIKKDNEKYYKGVRNKFNKNNIFISHNCPYRTKLDKLKRGPSKGEHYGSWLVKKVVRELKPFLVICGHIHESRGKQKTYSSLIINPGAAKNNEAAIIELDDKKRKVKSIKFLK